MIGSASIATDGKRSKRHLPKWVFRRGCGNIPEPKAAMDMFLSLRSAPAAAPHAVVNSKLPQNARLLARILNAG